MALDRIDVGGIGARSYRLWAEFYIFTPFANLAQLVPEITFLLRLLSVLLPESFYGANRLTLTY